MKLPAPWRRPSPSASPEPVRKSSAISRLLTVQFPAGKPAWRRRDYRGYAEEGYSTNITAYKCIRALATAVAGIPWILFEVGPPDPDTTAPPPAPPAAGDAPEGQDPFAGSPEPPANDVTKAARTRKPPRLKPTDRPKLTRIYQHPLLDLLKRPNPQMGGASLLEALVSYLNITGNAYLEAVGPKNGPPQELWVHRPDRMEVIPGTPQQPVAGYRYSLGGAIHTFTPDQILHLWYFNPLDDWYGMAPIQAAARSIDISNEARAHNMNLLQNNLRPPGVLSLKSDDVDLTDEEWQELKRNLNDAYSGVRNAGRALLIDGVVQWQSMALSPAELDWIGGLKLAAVEICAAFGVPPELIGDNANKTYSNFQEARKAFYMETVLPLLDLLKDELNNWLTPRFGANLLLDYDKNEIEALREDQSEVWQRVGEAWWLTLNQKLEKLGEETLGERGEVYHIPYSLTAVPASQMGQPPAPPPGGDDGGFGGASGAAPGPDNTGLPGLGGSFPQ